MAKSETTSGLPEILSKPRYLSVQKYPKKNPRWSNKLEKILSSSKIGLWV